MCTCVHILWFPLLACTITIYIKQSIISLPCKFFSVWCSPVLCFCKLKLGKSRHIPLVWFSLVFVYHVLLPQMFLIWRVYEIFIWLHWYSALCCCLLSGVVAAFWSLGPEMMFVSQPLLCVYVSQHMRIPMCVIIMSVSRCECVSLCVFAVHVSVQSVFVCQCVFACLSVVMQDGCCFSLTAQHALHPARCVCLCVCVCVCVCVHVHVSQSTGWRKVEEKEDEE